MIYLNDHIEDLNLEQALNAVSSQRREQALRFRQERDRKLSVAAYLLLCEALREEFGISELPQLNYGPNGKPFISDHPTIHFNLSHCDEAAVCVVSNQPVGVDVESIRRYDPALCSATMNSEEQHFIAQAPEPAVAFIRLWTMKESLLKLTGKGLKDDISNILEQTDSIRFTTQINATRGYIYTVCQTA
jgi:4'-phosphopantetheinyl transferase